MVPVNAVTSPKPATTHHFEVGVRPVRPSNPRGFARRAAGDQRPAGGQGTDAAFLMGKIAAKRSAAAIRPLHLAGGPGINGPRVPGGRGINGPPVARARTLPFSWGRLPQSGARQRSGPYAWPGG